MWSEPWIKDWSERDFQMQEGSHWNHHHSSCFGHHHRNNCWNHLCSSKSWILNLVCWIIHSPWNHISHQSSLLVLQEKKFVRSLNRSIRPQSDNPQGNNFKQTTSRRKKSKFVQRRRRCTGIHNPNILRCRSIDKIPSWRSNDSRNRTPQKFWICQQPLPPNN